MSLIRQYKLYILYIGIGLLIGAVARPVIIHLASYSMPEGWLEARAGQPFSLQHFVEPFWAAGQTLVRWLFKAVTEPFIWAFGFMVTHPSGAILGFIGAAVGFWLAYRQNRRRRRRGR